MKIIVQKFGGTSVASPKSRTACYQHIKKAREDGYKVVVVVSAMGRSGDPYATDTLLSLASKLPPKEKDLYISSGEIISASVFSSELRSQGIDNRTLTGGQAGIITNHEHGNAKIIHLQPEYLLQTLEHHGVVVVTGFQGKTPDGDVTTLGRGGSDTSATAIGVATKAEYVDIFTDVSGIMTADPRIVEKASLLERTTYTEICNLAYEGAKVIHPRAVEMAMQQNIPIRVRSTFETHAGTLVTTMTGQPEQEGISHAMTGITQTSNVTQFTVTFDESDALVAQEEIFRELKNEDISLDFISVRAGSIVFTTSKEDERKTKEVMSRMHYSHFMEGPCAKIALVGAGMAGVPGVMARISQSLSANKIQILQSADSHTTIWVLVKQKEMLTAVRSLHAAFQLDKPDNPKENVTKH